LRAAAKAIAAADRYDDDFIIAANLLLTTISGHVQIQAKLAGHPIGALTSATSAAVHLRLSVADRTSTGLKDLLRRRIQSTTPYLTPPRHGRSLRGRRSAVILEPNDSMTARVLDASSRRLPVRPGP
jgi:hypothetical protein